MTPISTNPTTTKATPHNANSRKHDGFNLYRDISRYAILCIAFLICVFNPYMLYGTDVTQFDSSQCFATLGALFGAFLCASFIAIYLISFIPKRFAKILAFIFSLTLFIGLIYSFILVGDYGVMNYFILQKTPFDCRDVLIVEAREFVAVVAIGTIIIAFVLKRLLYLWQIIFLTLFITSVVNATNIALKHLDSANFIESNANSTQSTTPPTYHLPYKHELFSYSKTHNNIVVVILDNFSSSHIKYILDQFPHLRKQLDGFTYFSNTLTSNTATIGNIAALIGGEYYTAYNMNARHANIVSEIDGAFIDIANAFAYGDFSVSMMVFVGSNIKNITPKLHHQIFTLNAESRAFDEFYMKRENLLDKVANAKEYTKNTQVALLINFGLFRFVPKFPLRANIYNEGKWLLDKKNQKTFNTMVAISYAGSFYALSRNVNADSTKATFKFIHSMMTHFPQGAYFDGKKCVFFETKTAWDDYAHEVLLADKNEQHYDAEVCALHYLVDFVENLKNAGIYNNTQLFIISDHGGSDSINMPNTNADALFLFKDFNAKGALKIDNRLMANYDISTIFCANLKGGCPNVGQNILVHYPYKREIIYTVPISYLLELHEPNKWYFEDVFKVNGNIYDTESWSKIR